MNYKSKLLNEVSRLITEGSAVNQGGSIEMFYEFRASSMAFLDNVFGQVHPIHLQFRTHCTMFSDQSITVGIASLKAAKRLIEDDWLTSVTDLVSAEIFSDFLEMAEHLLENKYKDPAAVIIGSVLEDHLRRLCAKHGIDTAKATGEPRKANDLNSELVKAGAYNALDNKSITSWLDLRNKAAHGKYTEYTIEQVILMHSGVRDFMTRTL